MKQDDPQVDEGVENALAEIVALAEVDASSAIDFSHVVRRAILEAKTTSSEEPKVTSKQLQNQLEAFENQLRNVQQVLYGSAPISLFVHAAIAEQDGSNANECVAQLEYLIKIALHAREVAGGLTKRGRPKATESRFASLVLQLFFAARSYGSGLTVYKSPHSPDGWDGTLLRAMRLLLPMLPHASTSEGNLGQALNQIVKDFRR